VEIWTVKDGGGRCAKRVRNTTARLRMKGELAPTDSRPAPAPFEMLSFNIIMALPFGKGYDAIMVVIDKPTKYGIFVPTV